jgi:uncharacterized protein YhfF
MTSDRQFDVAVVQMWDTFRQSCGVEAELIGAFAFGDSEGLADRLAQLVLHGPKRATAGLLVEFERDGEPLPRVGDHQVVLDGRGLPVCIIRTTAVDVGPLDQVDAAFAWDEGEGDRTLAWWQQAHREFFGRRCQQLGIPFAEDLPVVQERFMLVWPQHRGQRD